MAAEGRLLTRTDARGHPDSTPPSDEELFGVLYPDLWRFAAVTCPTGHDPDDLVQEAVERTLRRGPLSGLENPAAYLRRTIVHLAANERRRRGRQSRAFARTSTEAFTEDQHAFDVEPLLHLKPADRALLWMVDIEGLTFRFAAAVLGCTDTTARARASRARRALRQHLEEQDHNG